MNYTDPNQALRSNIEVSSETNRTGLLTRSVRFFAILVVQVVVIIGVGVTGPA
jgi:hypothetical protein